MVESVSWHNPNIIMNTLGSFKIARKRQSDCLLKLTEVQRLSIRPRRSAGRSSADPGRANRIQGFGTWFTGCWKNIAITLCALELLQQ